MNRARLVLSVLVIGTCLATAAETLISNPKFSGTLNLSGIGASQGVLPIAALPVVDPTAHVAQSIDTRISGLTANSTTKPLFSTYDHSAPSYVRNASVWSANVDLTCSSVWNSDGANQKHGVAISPRHILLANHFPIANGATLRFVTSNGTIVSRTLSNSAQVGSTDIRIGLLDSDLPSTVTYAKVLPANYASTLTLAGAPVEIVDQDRNALVADIAEVSGGAVLLNTPTNPTRASFNEELIVGDSGSPFFLVIDGAPVLLGTAETGGAGPSIADNLSAINTVMSTLGGGYSLTQVELPTVKQQLSASQISGLGSAATKNASAAYASNVANVVPLTDATGKLDAGFINSSSVTWEDVTGKPFTLATTGGNGGADAGKAVLFGSGGRIDGGGSSSDVGGWFRSGAYGGYAVIGKGHNAGGVAGYFDSNSSHAIAVMTRGSGDIARFESGGTFDGATVSEATIRLSVGNGGELKWDRTLTAAGTVGAATINKPAGTVNMAAGQQSLVVTNSLVTANSIVLPVIMTDDATATGVKVIPSAGSFTVKLNAAATAETRVGFVVTN